MVQLCGVPEMIIVPVRRYLRCGLSYREVEELLADRGIPNLALMSTRGIGFPHPSELVSSLTCATAVSLRLSGNVPIPVDLLVSLLPVGRGGSEPVLPDRRWRQFVSLIQPQRPSEHLQ